MDQDYSKAFRLFKFAADHGHGAARFYLGECYYSGRGVDKDYQEARRWYEKSAASGNEEALEALGVMYLNGHGVIKDFCKAKSYFKAPADKGLVFSQYVLAHFYLSRNNFKNNELGRAYLEKAANQGFIDAQKLLARCYVSGYGFDDDQKCYEWFLKAANQEDPEAERIMGYMYICYFVVPFSYEKAVEWFERAKLHGDVIAQIKLAECYMNGNGVTKDMSVGLDMLQDAETKIAADDGDAQERIADAFYDVDVQKSFDYYCKAYANGKKSVIYDLAWLFFINNKENNIYKNENKQQLLEALIEAENDSEAPEIALLLGKIFDEGRRGLSDSKQAEKWYLAANDKGSMKAACSLAEIYYQQGDFLLAFRFARKAHEGDFAEGTFLLGYYYKKGIGVKKNRSKAKILLKEAAEKGVKAAEEELKKFIF